MVPKPWACNGITRWSLNITDAWSSSQEVLISLLWGAAWVEGQSHTTGDCNVQARLVTTAKAFRIWLLPRGKHRNHFETFKPLWPTLETFIQFLWARAWAYWFFKSSQACLVERLLQGYLHWFKTLKISASAYLCFNISGSQIFIWGMWKKSKGPSPLQIGPELYFLYLCARKFQNTSRFEGHDSRV